MCLGRLQLDLLARGVRAHGAKLGLMWLGVVGGACSAVLAAAWPLGGKQQPWKPLGYYAADGADRDFVCAIFGGDLGLCGLVVALMLREIMVFLLFRWWWWCWWWWWWYGP